MPEGRWGQLNIRYNPNRPLPDGSTSRSTSPRCSGPTRRASNDVANLHPRAAARRRRRARGIGLPEMMIAVAISAALLTAVAISTDASFQAYTINATDADLTPPDAGRDQPVGDRRPPQRRSRAGH